MWSYSRARPLLEDNIGNASEVTRDYHIELDPSQGPPLLNVFGGKLTTYRKLSAEQPDLLGDALGNKQPAWTADARPLPGGGEPNIEALLDDIRASRH